MYLLIGEEIIGMFLEKCTEKVVTDIQTELNVGNVNYLFSKFNPFIIILILINKLLINKNIFNK